MRRISTIRNSREAEVEKRREELRDRRWTRHRSQVRTAIAAATTVVVLSQGGHEVVRAVRSLTGI